MQLRVQDFNGAETLVQGSFRDQWQELDRVLSDMPLHLKASDQAGIQGRPNFDTVGTNRYIADVLVARGWDPKIAIPKDFEPFGTDIDFGKDGAIVEVQFSNYPFLLNNTLRCELFFRTQTVFHRAPTGLAIIVTKGGMFPSSNSTLYYEQAFNQLTTLAQHKLFTIPLRLVGLFENIGRVNATWTDYSAARYSRTVGVREQRPVTITAGPAGRCRIRVAADEAAAT